MANCYHVEQYRCTLSLVFIHCCYQLLLLLVPDSKPGVETVGHAQNTEANLTVVECIHVGVLQPLITIPILGALIFRQFQSAEYFLCILKGLVLAWVFKIKWLCLVYPMWMAQNRSCNNVYLKLKTLSYYTGMKETSSWNTVQWKWFSLFLLIIISMRLDCMFLKKKKKNKIQL